MAKNIDADAVRKEFELFCKIGLDRALRAAIEAIPIEDLGLETLEFRCPVELRERELDMMLEVLDADDQPEQIVQMRMKLERFVRLRQFLERFDAEQVKTLQESLAT